MPASNAQQAAAAAKRKKAIALRLAGMDWEAIAEQTGYASAGAAHTAVSEALKVNLREQGAHAELLREQESMRYDRLLASAWPKALKGDLKAIETAARIIDRRVKLYGLAEAEKYKVDVTGEVTAEDLIRIIQGASSGADS